jgi:hypothetical protein
MVAASDKNMRCTCTKTLKSHWQRHGTAQTQQASSPRGGGQGKLVIFACCHMLAAHPTCRLNLTQIFCPSTEQSPEATKARTALRWVRCWRAEAYIRCTAHKSPDERQQSFCHRRTITTSQEAVPHSTICIVWH